MWNKYDKIGDLAELGLVITEISEAMEEIRKKEFDFDISKLHTECADIIIRVMNFMIRKGCPDIELVLINKTFKNMKRDKLHGKDV